MANAPSNDAPYRLLSNVDFGEDVAVQAFTNLYGCRIGDHSRIGPFVEIQSGVEIGSSCKIQSHSFICTGVTIEDEVFVGHGVIFINDKRPRSTTDEGELQTDEDWDADRDGDRAARLARLRRDRHGRRPRWRGRNRGGRRDGHEGRRAR